MNIEKLVQQLGKAIATTVMQKDVVMHEKLDFQSGNSLNILSIILRNLIHKGEYNKAENALFNELAENPSMEVYNLAKEFYNTLLSKSEDELIKNNFSKDEIYQGLQDAKSLIEKSIETKF